MKPTTDCCNQDNGGKDILTFGKAPQEKSENVRRKKTFLPSGAAPAAGEKGKTDARKSLSSWSKRSEATSPILSNNNHFGDRGCTEKKKTGTFTGEPNTVRPEGAIRISPEDSVCGKRAEPGRR